MPAVQDQVTLATLIQAGASVVSVVVTMVLVVITGYYARSTARLLRETSRAADAAERQAQAGAEAAAAASRSAESARRQALLMLHPSLVIDRAKVSIYESVIPQNVFITLSNVGSGEALEVEVRLEFAGHSRNPQPSQTFVPYGRMPIGQPHTLSFTIDDADLRNEWVTSPSILGTLSAFYDDVFGGRWTASWSVTIISGPPVTVDFGPRTVVSPYSSEGSPV